MISIDPKITKALENLDEELEVFEKQTGSQCMLILIPHYSDQPIHVSINGKVVEGATETNLEELFMHAMERRLTNLIISRKG
ncbi:MAG: hypothetical protein WAX66_03940 [Patescibacteria group bacterium]|jgi:hypothetical protein